MTQTCSRFYILQKSVLLIFFLLLLFFANNTKTQRAHSHEYLHSLQHTNELQVQITIPQT